MIPKRYSLAIASVTLAASLGYCSITFDLEADRVQTATPGISMSQTGLVLLIADTNLDGFADAVPTNIGSGSGDRTAQGNFLDGAGGNDLILFAADLTSDGVLFELPELDLGVYGGATWGIGNPLAIAWFPGLTLSSSVTSAGNTYGIFSDSSVTPAAGQSWLTPADGASGYQLYIFTENSVALPTGAGTGTSPNSDLVANLTVVPEAETYAALLGIAFLGYAIVRRRQSI